MSREHRGITELEQSRGARGPSLLHFPSPGGCGTALRPSEEPALVVGGLHSPNWCGGGEESQLPQPRRCL